MLSIQVLGKNLEVQEGTSFETIAKQFQSDFKFPILLAKQNNKLIELSNKIQQGGEVIFYDITCMEGMRVYHRSVSFLMIKAVKEMLGKKASVVIEHSLHKSLYCEIREKDVQVNQKFLDTLTEKMKSLVEKDIPINKYAFYRDDAIEKVREFGMENKARLFRFRRASNINLYEMDGVYDYFYGYMVPSTGYLKSFQLMLYENGFLIRFPDRKNPNEILKFTDPEKVSSVFMEQMKWCSLMKVNNVADLNEAITNGKFGDLVRINEALHEKKVAEIADKIYQKRDKVKVVLIAGPSSSGKTTFANRLCVQLRVLGIIPYAISLDDYFINREDVPIDEFGNKDFEDINTLDLKLFNDHITRMIAGETVEMPHYNFVTGKREYNGNYMTLEKGGIFVIEGIHGLNDLLTASIATENKFKIFISAMTQLNIDDHNRISTSDSRLIRRIVRDNQFRGRDATTTIAGWDYVTRGEEKNIFPFQENADAIFNSATIYELSVLKQYAEPLLFKIEQSQSEFVDAKRLIKFLDYFLGANGDAIPNNSIIKEFLGGSCFKV
ncbi:nucleoside kinase [Clostridium sp. MD294]|uniref:nucleoside kinase n=1 Tax=Clostridium sp. MD294 TaxID=97138 RepID=UPI0002CAA2B1|nr:nucleoside kinase [Clostridium sp. MD294]NDO46566.1 nucleoside kinase [Clostridium sp. MD294]USF29003.1 Uridine kinase [Clostridium sp. MD294]